MLLPIAPSIVDDDDAFFDNISTRTPLPPPWPSSASSASGTTKESASLVRHASSELMAALTTATFVIHLARRRDQIRSDRGSERAIE